jgi:hypothetical protein
LIPFTDLASWISALRRGAIPAALRITPSGTLLGMSKPQRGSITGHCTRETILLHNGIGYGYV